MQKEGGEIGKGHGNNVNPSQLPNYIHVLKILVPTWTGFPLSYRERINKQTCFSKRRKITAKLYTFNCSTITQVNFHHQKHILVIKKTIQPRKPPKVSLQRKVLYQSLNCANLPCDYHQLGTMEEL